MIARAHSLATLGVLFAIAGLSAGQQALTQQEAASMDQKLAAIAKNGESAKLSKGAAGRPQRTTLTEREVNAYLKFNPKELPKGLVDPQITIAGDRRLSGRALVDLDAVRSEKERGWLDPAAYLSGSLEVKATGLLQTSSGTGTFQLESATVGGVPIPKSLLQELVSHYSRSPELPAGIDLDKPFELPASIREVEIQRGAATIIQ
jgi:hypothetical protein